jgi:hypothetical protein
MLTAAADLAAKRDAAITESRKKFEQTCARLERERAAAGEEQRTACDGAAKACAAAIEANRTTIRGALRDKIAKPLKEFLIDPSRPAARPCMAALRDASTDHRAAVGSDLDHSFVALAMAQVMGGNAGAYMQGGNAFPNHDMAIINAQTAVMHATRDEDLQKFCDALCDLESALAQAGKRTPSPYNAEALDALVTSGLRA